MTAHLKIKSHAASAGLQYLLASAFSAYIDCLASVLEAVRGPSPLRKGPEPSAAASVFLLSDSSVIFTPILTPIKALIPPSESHLPSLLFCVNCFQLELTYKRVVGTTVTTLLKEMTAFLPATNNL